MFDKVCIPVLCGLLISAPPSKAQTAAYADILNGPVTDAEFGRALKTLAGCDGPECRALGDIWNAHSVIFRRDIPNSLVGTPRPRDPDAVADRALRRVILRHRERYQFYCELLEKMAGQYVEGGGAGGYLFGLYGIELANRIDGRGDRCTNRMIAAFPRNADTVYLLRNAYRRCVRLGHQPCARDRWPVVRRGGGTMPGPRRLSGWIPGVR